MVRVSERAARPSCLALLEMRLLFRDHRGHQDKARFYLVAPALSPLRVKTIRSRKSPVNSTNKTKKAKERLRGPVTCAIERLFWPPTCLRWGVWCRREPCRDQQFCVFWPLCSHRRCAHGRLALRQKLALVGRRRPRHHFAASVFYSHHQVRSLWGPAVTNPELDGLCATPDQTIAQVSIDTYWRRG
jgi:hypothetical protein